MIIGLTGYRGAGKSLACAHLESAHDFQKIHAFAGGKAACIGYFTHIGISQEDARRMVDGDLKETPCPLLPDCATPRFFMERFGKFLGGTLGPEWTLGQEIRLAKERDPESRILIDSVVYEADLIRSHGGVIVKMTREGPRPQGIETDKAVDEIEPDFLIENNGNDVAALHRQIDAIMDTISLERKAHGLGTGASASPSM